ncbi:hypothetical protein [Paenibacillus roseipurpureus]|uniref:Tissue inhibitor of metalloproteinase n=1 Tax=Paenibacillus roseopurpureus TaxID=2918901 RepID=A0AA96LPA4_9BACL|nr:hypothetical protein [Paenibacillus sp. MBLB1832]WNR44156.1 hypothetical protein MJB10_24165 [Paenibacillus sp. MBLB1832]
MKKWTLALVLMLLFGFFGTVMPLKTYACSCALQPDPMKALEQSKVVFSGKVLEIQDKTLNIEGIMDRKRAVLFDVEQTWKGISQSQAIVLTNLGGGSCGYDFQVGETYLVYAFSYTHQPTMLETGICSLTKELSAADPDIAKIGAGTSPTEKISLQGTMDRMTFTNKWAFVEAVYHRMSRYHVTEVMGAILLVGIGVLVVRKRRKER